MSFTVAEEARDFYKNGPSLLQRYLPFWINELRAESVFVVCAKVRGQTISSSQSELFPLPPLPYGSLPAIGRG
jgi:hypothetical protein